MTMPPDCKGSVHFRGGGQKTPDKIKTAQAGLRRGLPVERIGRLPQ